VKQERPLILFAHGAGAPSSSPWMRAWATQLGALGEVVPFDYPYMRQRKGRPDPMPTLIEAHRQALEQARDRLGRERPVVLAGKSMGSRVGCHLANDVNPAAVVCFGYPLRAAGSGALRDAVLLSLRAPSLFLQGTRDSLCPLDDLAAARARMSNRHQLFVVDGGDHSLALLKRDLKAQGRTQEDWDRDVLRAVAEFLRGLGL
jgi:uncharacterized protein